MTKITEEQLKEILSTQESLNKIVANLGAMEVEKHAQLHEFASINQEMIKIKADLEKEYGKVNIDLTTGECTEIEESKTLKTV
jgi:5'-3' exonuclease